MPETPATIDAVLTSDASLAPELIDQLAQKGGSILWTVQPQPAAETVDKATAAGITVISGKDAFEEAARLRSGNAQQVVVNV